MKRLILACLMVMALLAAVDAGAQVNWPLRISSHGAYLEDQSGVPFPVIGDAAWSAIVQLNQADLATYLNDRKAKGFTTLIMNAIEHYFSVNPPYDVYGNAPFTNGMNDWSVRNEAYWTNVDYVLNQAKSMGFLVLFYPAYLGYQCGSQGWCQNMEAQSEANMTGYGQFLGNRYKNQGNIIYVHAADAVAQDYTGVYARVVDIVNGIRSVDTTTLHTAESAPERSAMDDYSAFINVNTTYSGNDPAGKVQNDYTRSGALPDCFIESWYEGEETTTLSDVQSQALIAYLGGALLGHVFGNNPVYGFGYDGPWIPSLQSPGAVSMGNIGSLVKSRAWYLLAPDYANVVVTSNKGPGIRNYKATARTIDGATVMIWNPDSTPVTVNMTKISGSSANVWSWNPVNNTATLTGTYPTTGSQTFTPSAGTVLVLDNAGMGFNPPGVVGTAGAGAGGGGGAGTGGGGAGGAGAGGGGAVAAGGGGGGSGGCFIATVAFGSYQEGHVRILRQFRDTFLLTSMPGKAFVAWYYCHSPKYAAVIAGSPSLRSIARIVLLPVYAVAFLILNGLPVPLILIVPCAMLSYVLRRGRRKA